MMNSKTTPNDRQIRNSEITPPRELLDQWASEYWATPVNIPDHHSGHYIATQAARWGWEQHASDIEDKLQKARDEEFEACCDRLTTTAMTKPWETVASRPALVTALVLELRAARRPKPPSQAEEALEALDRMDQLPTAEDQSVIRRALERLQELEDNS